MVLGLFFSFLLLIKKLLSNLSKIIQTSVYFKEKNLNLKKLSLLSMKDCIS